MTNARATWLRAAILFGLGYFLVGRLFAVPGEHARAWRWAAWVVSGIIYAIHFRYERVRPGNPPRAIALGVRRESLDVANPQKQWPVHPFHPP